jgi:hypothetical protein
MNQCEGGLIDFQTWANEPGSKDAVELLDAAASRIFVLTSQHGQQLHFGLLVGADR